MDCFPDSLRFATFALSCYVVLPNNLSTTKNNSGVFNARHIIFQYREQKKIAKNVLLKNRKKRLKQHKSDKVIQLLQALYHDFRQFVSTLNYIFISL